MKTSIDYRVVEAYYLALRFDLDKTWKVSQLEGILRVDSKKGTTMRVC